MSVYLHGVTGLHWSPINDGIVIPDSRFLRCQIEDIVMYMRFLGVAPPMVLVKEGNTLLFHEQISLEEIWATLKGAL